jgi:hypothetical protein
MRITEIAVDKLFGRFDHRIPLHLEDRITIIYGPNGFGKTVLLRMVDGLFNGRYSQLYEINFRQLRIAFDDGGRLEVTRTPEHRRGKHQGEQGDVRLTLHYFKTEPQHQPFLLKHSETEIGERYLGFVEHVVPDLARIAPTRWRHMPSGEVLTLEEILERYGERFPSEMRKTKNEPEWWQEIRKAIPVRLIETQRLLGSSRLLPSSSRARPSGSGNK